MLLLVLSILSGIWFHRRAKVGQRNATERWFWAFYGAAFSVILFASLSSFIADVFDASSSTLLVIVIVALVLSAALIFYIGRILPSILPRQPAADAILNASDSKLISIVIIRLTAAILFVCVFSIMGGFTGDKYDIEIGGSDDFKTGLTFFGTLASVVVFYGVYNYLIALRKHKRIQKLATTLLVVVGIVYLYLVCAFWLRLLEVVELPMSALR